MPVASEDAKYRATEFGVLRKKMRHFYIIIIFLVLFPCMSSTNTGVSYEQAKAEFNVLKEQWDKEIPQFSSNTNDYWQGDAARAILKMGKLALPFMFREIENGNFFFNVAAERITQITLKDENDPSEQAHSKLWIEWWKQNRNNPEWNLFLNGAAK